MLSHFARRPADRNTCPTTRRRLGPARTRTPHHLALVTTAATPDSSLLPRAAGAPPGAARPGWLTDEVVRRAVLSVAVLAVVLGLAFQNYVRPFPWTVGLLVLALCIAARAFGIPLPGKGFASFVIGPAVTSVFALGWAAGALVSAAGMALGDVAVRRLPARNALSNSAHIAMGCALGGAFYTAIGGGLGAAAFAPWNVWRLALLCAAVPLVVNASFYLQLRLSPAIAWVDVRLTMRWEGTVAVLATLLGLGALRLHYSALTPAQYIAFAGALCGLAFLAHWLVRQGAMGESLLLVQRLASVITARAEFTQAVSDIQRLTRTLVPWQHMRVAAYDAARREFVILSETDAAYPPGTRLPSREGMTPFAVGAGRAMADVELPHAGQEAWRRSGAGGSEILVPLYHGEQLAGLWSIRHALTRMYRAHDACMLQYLAPQLALSLQLDALVQPVLAASERTATQVEAITASTASPPSATAKVTYCAGVSPL